MSQGLVTQQEDFAAVCDEIRSAGIVAMDTEFVSEGSYRPELCLLQLAVPGREIVVDPLRSLIFPTGGRSWLTMR